MDSLRSLSVLLAAPVPAREFQMTPQALLRLHPFFSTLPQADIDELLMRTRHRRVLAGEVLFEKDAPGDGLYGVLSGRIAFSVDSADGKALTLNVLGPGEFFGEIALLDGKGRSASAMVRESAELLFMAREEFLSFVRNRPDVMIHITALVCGRLRRSTEYIADTAFLDLPQRLAKQLVFLLNGHDASPQGGLRISHAELASMLGVSRERVSRQLAVWGGKGILEQGRGHLLVRDPQALEQLVGDV